MKDRLSKWPFFGQFASISSHANIAPGYGAVTTHHAGILGHGYRTKTEPRYSHRMAGRLSARDDQKHCVGPVPALLLHTSRRLERHTDWRGAGHHSRARRDRGSLRRCILRQPEAGSIRAAPYGNAGWYRTLRRWLCGRILTTSGSGPIRPVLYKGRGDRREWQSWYAPGIYRRDGAPPAADELPQPIMQDGVVRSGLNIDQGIGPVAVVGATGRLGLEVLRALRSQGVTVRALARDRDRAAALLPADVDRAIIDVRDAAAFAGALRGIQRVVFAASATAGGAGDNTPRAVEYEAVCTLAAAARSLSLAQVLLVSSAACSQREHIHNLWGDILLWKLRSEEVLRSSGVPYTILRPTGLRAHPGGRRGIRFVQGDRIALGEEISRVDVASLCVALLADPHGLGKTFEAYNDDSLPPGAWVGTFERLRSDV